MPTPIAPNAPLPPDITGLLTGPRGWMAPFVVAWLPPIRDRKSLPNGGWIERTPLALLELRVGRDGGTHTSAQVVVPSTNEREEELGLSWTLLLGLPVDQRTKAKAVA